MKLYIIYVGGAHERSFIELHDMRFVVASKHDSKIKIQTL